MPGFPQDGFYLHVQARRPLGGTLRLLSRCPPTPPARNMARGSGSGHRHARSARLLIRRSAGLERDEALKQSVSLTLCLDQQVKTLCKD
jgi:hypothetical protein